MSSTEQITPAAVSSPTVNPNFAEQILSTAREIASRHEIEHAISVNADRRKSVPLADVALCLNGVEGYASTLSPYWARHDGPTAKGLDFFIADKAAPYVLEFRTTNRLGFLDFAPELAKALDKQNVSLTEDTSWYWDQDVCTPSGRPTYRTVFVLRVFMENKKFSAATWLRSALKTICESESPLADEVPTEAARELDAGFEIMSVSATKQGWDVSGAPKKSMDRLCAYYESRGAKIERDSPEKAKFLLE